MNRLKLLLGIWGMTGLLVCTVALFSPYAPVVAPVAQIEEIWAIEDARVESDVPLVTCLHNRGVPLGYDAATNTFYCSLGMDQQEDWPEIHLTAPQAKGVQMVYVDDYSYDFCADAIREGYPYQVMAYTQDEYAYFDIVFTGLMQVHLTAQAEFSELYIPTETTISCNQQTVQSHARAHYRGGVTMHSPKKPYRVEFTRNADGTRKIMKDVPGMGQMENLILIPMRMDDSHMRDRLAWDLYGLTHGEEDSYGTRRICYAELFVNDSYEGLYLLMEPFDHAQELNKRSIQAAGTDCTYRTGSVEAEKDRPNKQGAYLQDYGYEMHYEPAGAEPFAAIDPFIALCKEEDDGIFAGKLAEIVDIDSMIDYFLHLQAYSMIDNVFNNLFVIANYENGAYKIRFAPWDMDMTMGTPGHPYDMWVYFPPMDRALDLNVDGIRTRTLDRWKELRAGVLTTENVERYIAQYEHELNDSGAKARNAERWELEETVADGSGIVNYAADRFALLDQLFERIAEEEGPVPMRWYTDYGNKYISLSNVDWYLN